MAPARSYGLPWHLLYPLTVSQLKRLSFLMMPFLNATDLLDSGADSNSHSSILIRLTDLLRFRQQPDPTDQVWKQELLRL